MNQTIGIDALQLIFVNDASTDRTGRKLAYWQAKYPDSIEVITLPENLRQGGARNEGMKHIAAPLTGFVDSDDWAAPEMFEILYEAMQENGFDFVNPDSTILSANSSRHFDRLAIEEKKLQEYRRLNIFDTYYREFEYQFLRVYYINSLHTFFLRISDMTEVPFDRMQEKVMADFPDYKNNPYLERFNTLEKELLKTLELKLSDSQWQLLADNYRNMMRVKCERTARMPQN